MAALTTADCNAINTAIVRETGRIGPEIYTRIVRTSPWIGLTPSDTWPDGMGLTQTSMTFERMLPADDNETWTDVAVSNGTLNNCLPATEILKWGQTLRTWNLQKIAKQSEDFCIEDLRSAFELQKILTLFTQGLGTVSKRVLENRNQNEYVRLAQFKITEGPQAGFNIDTTAFDAANPPTSRLTNGTLEQVYARLNAEGAGEAAMGASGIAMPVYGLFTDPDTSRDLIRQDPELRADFRFAYMGKGDQAPLVMPMGVERSYNGYAHIINFLQPRWNIVGGQYVSVPRYKAAVATTSGFKRDINGAYDYAQYADTIIHVPNVFTRRVPQPISSPGGRFKFDPVNYVGEFSWKNILHAVCNPDGTIGFFRAVFASGSEPVHPEYGYVIRHMHCPSLRGLRASCYS